MQNMILSIGSIEITFSYSTTTAPSHTEDMARSTEVALMIPPALLAGDWVFCLIVPLGLGTEPCNIDMPYQANNSRLKTRHCNRSVPVVSPLADLG